MEYESGKPGEDSMTMMTKENIGFSRTVDSDFDTAIARVTETLAEQGFGVLTEIDVKATLKAKLDQDFRKYRILGACNPPFAHKALEAELLVGLMMPCNVIVYEDDEERVNVVGFNPEAMLAAFDRPELVELAAEISQRMKAAVENM